MKVMNTFFAVDVIRLVLNVTWVCSVRLKRHAVMQFFVRKDRLEYPMRL
jgi:hypothetical protein